MLLPGAGCLPPDEGTSGVGEKAEASSVSAMPDGRTRAISLAAKATPSARGRYREAPSLRQRVEANDLPPLEERLPDIPLVVAPISEPGRYGGTIRRAASNRLANVPPVINLEDVTRGWDRAIFSEQLYFRE